MKPKRDEVDKGILEELKKKTPVEEIIEKIKDKIEYPQEVATAYKNPTISTEIG